jgi:hypothetical protein
MIYIRILRSYKYFVAKNKFVGCYRAFGVAPTLQLESAKHHPKKKYFPRQGGLVCLLWVQKYKIIPNFSIY